MLVFSLATLCTAAAGGTIYVDDDATGANDGSSWTDAYNYLQDALANAHSAAKPVEIRVAQGTYKPDEDTAHPTGTSDYSATFQLISGVAIYGGIGGGESILSGDIGITGGSYHVVTGSGTDGTAVLDGFTISGGNAPYSYGGHEPYSLGGGMYNYDSSATVTNCTFSGNSAERGGGMYNYNSNLTVTNCTFTSNSAYVGGGMYNYNCSPTVTNCTFSGNSAVYKGGGMCNNYYNSPTVCSPTVTNCTFSGNSSPRGGGMHNTRSSPTVTNCTFNANWAQMVGGGMQNLYYSDPTVTNCTFIANLSYRDGGGMSNWDFSSPTVTNCTFAANSAVNGNGVACDSHLRRYPSNVQLVNCILWDGGDEVWNNDASTITISYSDVHGGWSGTGNIDADPLFADADLRLSAGSPCIDAGDNTAVPAGATTDLDGNPRIFNGIVDMGAYESEGQGPSVITVEIDIKPGSYPNTINLGSQGVIPVAILSSSDFDATTVNPDTVELAGAGVAMRGKGDKYLAHEEDVNGDGLLDLVCKVETDNLDPETFQYGFIDLTGETYDGVPIKGEDEIIIVPPEE